VFAHARILARGVEREEARRLCEAAVLGRNLVDERRLVAEFDTSAAVESKRRPCWCLRCWTPGEMGVCPHVCEAALTRSSVHRQLAAPQCSTALRQRNAGRKMA